MYDALPVTAQQQLSFSFIIFPSLSLSLSLPLCICLFPSFASVTYGDEHLTSKKSIAPKITLSNSIAQTFFLLHRVHAARTRTLSSPLSPLSICLSLSPLLSLSLSLSFSLSLSLSLCFFSISLMEHIVPGRWSLYARRQLSSNSD